MDKTNKYYNVIENLVKQHKKFPGCEPIIEDIIDDVFAHSEVIINSISNESVILPYLEKVISTSIITVPKKLNFHTEIKHRVVTKSETLTSSVNKVLVDKMINASAPQEIKTNDKNVQASDVISHNVETISLIKPEEAMSLDTSFENETLAINLSPEASPLELTEPEEIQEEFTETVADTIEPIDDIADNFELTEPEEIQEEFAETVTDTIEPVDDVADNFELAEPEEIQEEFTETVADTIEPIDDVADNFELTEPEEIQEEFAETVTDTIEPIDDIADNFELTEPEEIQEEFAETVTDTIEPIDDIADNFELAEPEEIQEEFAETVTDTIEPIDDIADNFELAEPEEIQEELAETVTDTIEPIDDVADNFELTEPEEIQEEFAETVADTIEPIDDVTDNFELEASTASDAMFVQTSETDEFLQADDENLSLDFSSQGDDLELLDDEEQALEPIESDNFELISDDSESSLNISNEEIQLQASNAPISFKHIDYSVFGYTPNIASDDIDENDLTKELQELDIRKPQLQILKVYELKYKSKLTVTEVAERLNMDETEVLESLSEMISIV